MLKKKSVDLFSTIDSVDRKVGLQHSIWQRGRQAERSSTLTAHVEVSKGTATWSSSGKRRVTHLSQLVCRPLKTTATLTRTCSFVFFPSLISESTACCLHKRSTSVIIKNKELSKLSNLDDQDEEEIYRPHKGEGMQNVRFCDDQLGAVDVHSVP